MRFKRLVIALLILLAVEVVSARDLLQGDDCTIDATETITGNLFVICRTLTVDGHITGNLMGAATNVQFNGAVDSDLYIVAIEMDMRGAVGDNLHFAGSTLRLHDTATFASDTSDLISLSLSTDVMDGAEVPGHIISAGYQLLINGAVGGEIQFWGTALLVNGVVNGAIDARVGDSEADISQLQTGLSFLGDLTLTTPGLTVNDGAQIDGLLSYSAPREGEIAEGTLAQPPQYTQVVIQPDFTQITPGEEDQARGFNTYLTQFVREFFALGIIGLVGLIISQRAMQLPLRTLQIRALPSLAVGLLTFIVALVGATLLILLSLLIIALVSLLAINELTFTVASILGIIDIGGTGLLIFTAIFVSRVVVCLALGQIVVLLLTRGKRSQRTTFISLFVGVLLLALVVALPFIGLIVNGVAAFFGLGAILLTAQAQIDTLREANRPPQYAAATTPVLPPRPAESHPSAPPPPPPIIEDQGHPLGAGNLPDGFEWWDD